MGEYLIWSNEHRAWWKPNRQGYARRVEHAGRYSREAAVEICTAAFPGTSVEIGMLPELPLLEKDVLDALARFAALYPGHDPEPAR